MGYVPDDLLPNLYSEAAAFIFPSLYEGFRFADNWKPWPAVARLLVRIWQVCRK